MAMLQLVITVHTVYLANCFMTTYMQYTYVYLIIVYIRI